MLAGPLLAVAISSLWSVSTSKDSNKAFLHLMAWDQVFLLYLSAVTFHFYKCPWHMIHCIATWLVSSQPGQFCCGLLASCWWNNLILGLPYVRGSGYWYGRREQRESNGPDVVRKKRLRLSLAVGRGNGLPGSRVVRWPRLGWTSHCATSQTVPKASVTTAPTGRRKEGGKGRPWMIRIIWCQDWEITREDERKDDSEQGRWGDGFLGRCRGEERSIRTKDILVEGPGDLQFLVTSALKGGWLWESLAFS